MSEPPTMNEVLALMSDPDHRSAAAPANGYQRMNSDRILGRLQDRGVELGDARVLIGRALVMLGGLDRSRRRTSGLRSSFFVEEYWVPASIFTDAPLKRGRSRGVT